jgi:hypothetical protein
VRLPLAGCAPCAAEDFDSHSLQKFRAEMRAGANLEMVYLASVEFG